MKRTFIICFGVLVGVLSLHIIHADKEEILASEDQINRGRYLAMGVAMCVDCHSPKLNNGLLDTEQILMGTEITFAPLDPVPDWVGYAPAIAGLPTYTEDEMVEVLTTGMIGNSYLRPPMPVYRMNRDDAEAIVAYLASLRAPESP
jgi:mono/diheme cytochrome c family protein